MRQVNDISVTVSVASLIVALKRNKEKHIAEYNKAMAVYFGKLSSQLSTMMDGVERKDASMSYTITLQKPINKSADYDKYIGMLEMAKETEMEINLYQYECFINDTWEWVVGAKALNSTYIG